MKKLHPIYFSDWRLANGKTHDVALSYQVFGRSLGTAPVVLVNHALTGNSNVSGETGWWNALIGDEKTIDTQRVTVLAFNIPGNGYDDEFDHLIFNYRDFTAKDVAALFWKGLETLHIDTLFAVIGGSLGGGIAWEMAALKPKAIQHLIPVATDWKATDWVIANVLVQDQILNHSSQPIQDARTHAMLLYRTPQSLGLKFKRNKNGDRFDIENWLIHHGVKLQDRFRLASYRLMNHLLRTINIVRAGDAFLDTAARIESSIHLIAVDSDLFFIPSETRQTYEVLSVVKPNVFYHEIKSVHGHDAFLIEYEQLAQILSPIFEPLKVNTHVTTY
ncbi:alpha/beta fold hydrolase [Flavobacterium caeni]|uniref:Homoserine O-acetyltransferase n=1 Tax=Flavobacterium caeni TaxID=490189 RepID=A0A1G5JUI3_9FLAO|nr:alpha/beta fold hydrolase [Flavobacterium caeni]SCY91329.1 homoserine O-acetyltransferase [Flavobacterium caeni]